MDQWTIKIPLSPVRELVFVLIIAVGMHMLRTLVASVALRIADHYKVTSKKQRRKVASNAWYGTYYLCAAVTGAWLLWTSGWWSVGNICAHADALKDFDRFPLLYYYYCVQVAFYLNYIFAMVSGIDVKRKDFWAFALHHVITMGLIVYSRNANHMRTGLAVFAIHDAADPLVHFAKMLKYTGAPELHSDIVFGLFIAVFFATRWILYPWWVVEDARSNWMTLDVWARDGTCGFTPLYQINDNHLVFGGCHLSYYAMALILLFALFGLHVYWGAYIIRMVWRKFVEGAVGDDVNSDGEEEDEEEMEKKIN